MFAVAGSSFVRPPGPLNDNILSDKIEYQGLGLHDNLSSRYHMKNMRETVPHKLSSEVVEVLMDGCAMAYDNSDSQVGYAEWVNNREGQRVSLIIHGSIGNEAEIRELYDLPMASASTDVLHTSSSAHLLMDLYCKGFMDAYGDRSAQPETCIEAFQGNWAFCLFDELNLYVLAARDAGGLAPLYWGSGITGALLFSSDSRLLEKDCNPRLGGAVEFPSGNYFESDPSFEHGIVKSFVKTSTPMRGLTPVPSQEQLCGTMFRAGSTGDVSGMVRVSSHTDITAQ